MKRAPTLVFAVVVAFSLGHFLRGPTPLVGAAGGDWPQLKFDARRSGNVPDRSVKVPLGLVGAVPLTDAVLTEPVVAGGRIYVVDGAGVAFGIDAATLRVAWKHATRGGRGRPHPRRRPRRPERPARDLPWRR